MEEILSVLMQYANEPSQETQDNVNSYRKNS